MNQCRAMQVKVRPEREDHKSSVGCQTPVGKPSYLFYIYDPGVLKPLMNQIKSLGKREVVKTEKNLPKPLYIRTRKIILSSGESSGRTCCWVCSVTTSPLIIVYHDSDWSDNRRSPVLQQPPDRPWPVYWQSWTKKHTRKILETVCFKNCWTKTCTWVLIIL